MGMSLHHLGLGKHDRCLPHVRSRGAGAYAVHSVEKLVDLLQNAISV